MKQDDSQKRPVAILDRDGTLIENIPYLAEPARVRLLDGVAGALRALREAGWLAVLLSNQSGVGRGLIREDELHRVNARLVEALAAEGARLDGLYYCPHAPDADCDCRKPRDGLVRRAAAELGFDPALAVVVGDNDADIELAETLGRPAYLVLTGHGAAVAPRWRDNPAVRIVANFPAAVADMRRFSIHN